MQKCEQLGEKTLTQWLVDSGMVKSGKQVKDALARAAVLINNKPQPDSDFCSAYIRSTADGRLPIGAQTWSCHHGGKFVGKDLTVTLLVRPIRAPSAAIANPRQR